MKMLHCEDCLAHYSEGYNHVCPPWLKALVARKKRLDAWISYCLGKNKGMAPEEEIIKEATEMFNKANPTL